MNREFLKLTGRVVRTNAADQSFLIESNQSHTRLWVYADNKAFQRLNNSLLSAQFKGTKGRELIGTFYIQGRVLKHFIKEGSTPWKDMCRAANDWTDRGDQSK
jgi:hypothetical protein